MKRKPRVTGLCIGLLVALGACGIISTSADPNEDAPCDGFVGPPADNVPSVQFELTFTGDVSFQGPHAGDRVVDALICPGEDGFAGGSGSIFGPPETFSFSVISSVWSGDAYQIYLWIDSNIGGGTEGVCDPPAIDHQWNVTIPTVTGDVNIIFSHDDATVTDVCSVFDGQEFGF